MRDTMDRNELRDRLAFARTIAREAAAIALGYFRGGGYEVEAKADQSPVTRADREAELHLRACIAAGYPDDGILGEEYPEVPGHSGYRWILDPIDGTKAFVHGVPLFGTMVGVERDRVSQLGVVEFPALDEVIWAARGEGCWHLLRGEDTPRRARVSTVSTMAEALFLVTDVDGFEAIGAQTIYDRIRRAVRLQRGWNDCYAYNLVATGRAEFVIDTKMNVWDCAALQPILEEAGGRFTSWDGEPTIWDRRIVGCNAALHPKLLEFLADG